MRAGYLDRAERSFKHIAALDPNVAGAYSNRGVIYMRRKTVGPGTYYAGKGQPHLRGQILVRNGQKEQGQAELATAAKIMNAQRTRRQQELDSEPLLHAELTASPD